MVFIKDITDDISKTVYANLISKVSVPKYVKSAQVETKGDLPPRAFADSILCKLPLNTKASCWTSALYLYGNSTNKANSRYPIIEDTLVKHAEVWGITEDIGAIKKAFTPIQINAEYALSMDFRGKQVDRCPCHTSELAKKSCSWLYDHRNHFPIKTQIKAATTLIEKVGGLENTPDTTRDYLGSLAEAGTFATAPNIVVANAITERLVSVKSAQWGELGYELYKVAKTLAEAPYELTKEPRTIQNALEAFDTQFNLQQKWGTSFTHPVDACYSITRAKAAAAVDGSIKLMNGNYFDINSVALSDIETGLKMAGDDFLNYAKPDGINLDMSKVKEVLPTIPAPYANRFQSAFSAGKQAGILHGDIPEGLAGVLGSVDCRGPNGLLFKGEDDSVSSPASI